MTETKVNPERKRKLYHLYLVPPSGWSLEFLPRSLTTEN